MMDINCDAGESFGRWTLGEEEALFAQVTSVNIACGFHAGDPWHLQQTIARALRHGLRLGAHPSYPDLVGFGRRYMQVSSEELHALLVYQISAVKGMVEAQGGQLSHVKPHGALYNESAQNPGVATVIAQAVKQISPELQLFGLAGSASVVAGKEEGLPVWSEVFADRSYESNGTLTPRSLPGSVLTDEASIRRQVRSFVQQKPLVSRTGELVNVHGETICLHSDTPGAATAAVWIREEVNQATRLGE